MEVESQKLGLWTPIVLSSYHTSTPWSPMNIVTYYDIKVGSTTQLKMNSYFIEIELWKREKIKKNKKDISKEKGWKLGCSCPALTKKQNLSKNVAAIETPK